MEVIRSSDIARLVLGYLRDNNLDSAAKLLCKTSPYLKEEYKLMRKGFRWINLGNDSLNNILIEYCEIKSKVVQFINSLPVEVKDRFTIQGNLLAQLSISLKAAKRDLIGKNGAPKKSLKRRISIGNDENVSFETTQEKDLPGYSAIPAKKKQRVCASLLFLNGNKSQEHDPSEDESTSSSSSHSRSSVSETVISLSQPSKPGKTADISATKEPSTMSSFPNISEILLENTEFQNKLAANINKVLSIGPQLSGEKKSAAAPDEIYFPVEEMIQHIWAETENDPNFNELIEDIALSNAGVEPKPATNNQSTQCSPQCSPEQSAPEPVATTSFHEPSLKDRLRPRKANISNKFPLETDQGPSFITPAKTSVDADLRIGSFLTDPNFSLSKFIVLNPDDTITTSTPLISDSLLGSTAALNPSGENIFFDANTGQMTIPLYVSNDIHAVYFNTEISQQLSEENEPCARLIEPAVEKISVSSQAPTEQINKNNLENRATLCVQSVDKLNQVASLDSSRICRDKETPLANIASTEMVRSFSTPRRTASHVRMLNFSTPLKPPSDGNKSAVPVPESQVQPIIAADDNVAIINQIPIIVENITVGHESSNSSASGFTKTLSDATVIQQNISETPKRKSNGRRTCARMLSRSSSEETKSLMKKKQERKKKLPLKAAAATTKPPSKSIKKPKIAKNTALKDQVKTTEKIGNVEIDSLDAWKKLRSIPPGEWDKHIREISAKTSILKPPRSNKKKMRKIDECKTHWNLNESYSTIDGDSSETSNSFGSSQNSSFSNHSVKKPSINFKFVMASKLNNDLSSSKSPENNKRESAVTLERIIESTADSHPTEVSVVSVEQNCTQEQPKVSKALLEKCTNNMALLLDTPLKTDSVGIPITPRFVVPSSNETPISKMMNSCRDQISMCKNPDMPTPNFAITPGVGLTPIDRDTPRSGHRSSYATDYSSGGSYYKPDESEDLDKHFDKMLTVERTTLKLKAKEISAIEPSYQVQNGLSDGDSSSQTIIAIINTSAELREQQIECLKLLEKVESLKKATTPPHNTTLQEDLPENTISNNSTTSSSSSSSSSTTQSTSSSSSSSNSANNSKNNISWEEPHTSAKPNEEFNEKSKVPQLPAENVEVRYPLRSFIIPKIAASSTASHIAEVVNKVKAKLPHNSEEKESKQLSDLEEKRLRMKQKLKTDFCKKGKKCSVQAASKVTKITYRTSKKVSIPSPSRTIDQHTNAGDQIDVLAALNLSVKKTERPNSMGSASLEEVLTLRIDDDSKESVDTKEIRNAAHVLTNLSKGSAEASIQNRSGNSLEKPTIKKTPAKKGRPRKASTKAAVTIKLYPPQKPVTRRDSKDSKQAKILLKSRKPEVCAIEESPGTHADTLSNLNRKTRAQSVSPKSIHSAALIKLEEMHSSHDQPRIDNLVDKHRSETSSSDQDEDEDPYDVCESITIDESDNLRYHHVIHESPSEVETKLPLHHTEDLSSMVMNVFLKGALHKLVVADPIELFATKPMTINVKSAAVLMEKKQCKPESFRKKLKNVTARGKKQLADKRNKNDDDDLFEEEKLIVSPVQPKINIKYENKANKKDKTRKFKTEIKKDNKRKSRSVKLGNKSNLSTDSSIVVIPTPAAPPEASKSIKNEDINAVLSHLYGSDYV